MSSFSDFPLDPGLLAALEKLGFETPTPIQSEAIPVFLEGRDVVARARTGSGKTAAFGLPLLQKALTSDRKGIRALVLAPTRELALQVTDALRSMAPERAVPMVTLYGGASYGPQLQALRRGVQVVVATPGRLLDHMQKGTVDLSTLDMVVLDEADEMLRMGFIDDVSTILAATPADRQVALFSATMPAAIRRIADAHLRDPLTLGIDAGTASTDHIKQGYVRCRGRYKLEILQRLLAGEVDGTSLIFARTRAGCAEIADALAAQGIAADGLHGNLAQSARERVLGRLRSGRLDVVVATDVASRGIDVDHITHVINADLPPDHETYTHRIGRTGRAGRQGTAISLVLPGEVGKLKRWMRTLKVTIHPVEVPSDAMIHERRLSRLRSTLADVQEQPEFRRAAAFVEDTLKESPDDWTSEKLAAAAIALLDKHLGLSAMPADSRGPNPHQDRDQGRDHGRDRGPRPERQGHDQHAAAGGPELFIPVGHNRGIRPGDLVGALANECGVPGSVIGKVTIVERKSFVQMPAEHLERLLAEHRELELRGQHVPIDRARPQGAMDHRPSGGAPFNKQRRPYKRAPKPGFKRNNDG